MLITANTRGLFGRIFNDFGPEFAVEDPNGEPPHQVFIEFIDKESGNVTTLEDAFHNFEDGDLVTFREIRGMTELNGQTREVKVISELFISLVEG